MEAVERVELSMMVKEDLRLEWSKIKGVYDMMRGLSLSLYSLTIARWTNPTLYAMAWRIISLSLTDERMSSGALDGESYQAVNSAIHEDPLPPLPPSPPPFVLDDSPGESLKKK